MKFFEDCAVGEEFESHSSYRITAEEIKSFATKWDPQLYHLDEEEAKRVVGQLFAPGTLTLCIGVKLTHDSGVLRDLARRGVRIGRSAHARARLRRRRVKSEGYYSFETRFEN